MYDSSVICNTKVVYLSVLYAKIQHSFNEQGVRLKAHTLFIEHVLYLPISHLNEPRLYVLVLSRNNVLFITFPCRIYARYLLEQMPFTLDGIYKRWLSRGYNLWNQTIKYITIKSVLYASLRYVSILLRSSHNKDFTICITPVCENSVKIKS